jgi:Ca2+-binding RTX toxin-like protein
VDAGLTCNVSSLSGADLGGRARVDRQVVDKGAYERKAPAQPFSKVLFGSAGPNDLAGGAKRDLICGFAGKDEAEGRDASDLVILGAGNDDATGGGGADRVIAGSGDDVIAGGAGGDVLKGRDGVRNNDTVLGGPGPDTCTADRRDTVSNC